MKILLMALTLGIVASAQIVNNGTGTGGSGGGTAPYVVPSFTGSPQTVTAATMLAAGKPQGPDAQAICWFSSAPSVGLPCTTSNSNPAGAGDITFAYGENPFRVVIATPGSGSQGATGAAGAPGLGCGTLGGVLGGTCAAATLNNTAVTPGSYTNTNLTVGADGRITAATNGSGGGAGTASQLGDLSPVNTTSTRQTFGGSCSTSTPCIIRVGNVYTVITAPVTVDISGTSSADTLGYYLLNGTLFVGMNGAETLTCSSGCTVAAGFVANTFPPGSIPLWQPTITGNTFDTIVPATMDKRAVYSTQNIKAGTGMASSSDPTTGAQTLSALSPIVGRSDLTAQSAALTSTALFTPSSTGYYRISYTTKITTPGTSSILGGTTGFVLSYTDGTDSVAQTLTLTASSQAGTILTIGSGNTGNATTTISYGSAVVFALGGVASTYNFGYSSTGTTMVYEIHVRAEAIL